MSPIFLLLVILLIILVPVLSWYYYDKIKAFMRKARAFILCQPPTPVDQELSHIGPGNQQVYFIGCERIRIEPLPNIKSLTSASSSKDSASCSKDSTSWSNDAASSSKDSEENKKKY